MTTSSFVLARHEEAPERRKRFLAFLLLCAACLLLNIAGLNLALALGLTLYLDNVGTILAAAAGGFLPAVVVGVLTNAIASISSPFTAYYGSLTVLIGLCTAYVAQKGWLKKATGLLMTAVLLLQHLIPQNGLTSFRPLAGRVQHHVSHQLSGACRRRVRL